MGYERTHSQLFCFAIETGSSSLQVRMSRAPWSTVKCFRGTGQEAQQMVWGTKSVSFRLCYDWIPLADKLKHIAPVVERSW